MRIFNWVISLLAILIIGVWLYSNFGKIQSKHLTDAEITSKSHEEEKYYIHVNDQKIHVKDTNMWMVLKEGRSYDLTYEWYGTKTPYIKEINQTGDEDQIGGGH
ncbi:hypothetical protein [Thalassobacillus sp. CUG 92003]|uniref:hypothetical protein n=1 Tax=Thalassobacillus sp. CUG 92003 TaxID=2736641 RepID=UPI0015E7C5DF|nr:hypothetical protein [Thalassobacillus sp. CUG 92003]